MRIEAVGRGYAQSGDPADGSITDAESTHRSLFAIRAGPPLTHPRYPDGTRVPHRDWVDDFMATCAAFPKAAHDDDVDALSQLLWSVPGTWREDRIVLDGSCRSRALPARKDMLLTRANSSCVNSSRISSIGVHRFL